MTKILPNYILKIITLNILIKINKNISTALGRKDTIPVFYLTMDNTRFPIFVLFYFLQIFIC